MTLGLESGFRRLGVGAAILEGLEGQIERLSKVL